MDNDLIQQCCLTAHRTFMTQTNQNNHQQSTKNSYASFMIRHNDGCYLIGSNWTCMDPILYAIYVFIQGAGTPVVCSYC